MAFILFLFTSFHPPVIKPYGLNVVVIDAGHGGHDPGCLGKKTKEKDVTLGIALKIGKYIEDRFPDVKVIYTRQTDVFVELYERAEKANNAKADLFISIHCNSACFFDKKKRKEICSGDIHGVESWVMGLHKTEANLEVAKRENEVILMEKDYSRQYDGFDPNSAEANIIFSLYQNTFLEQSLRMATNIQKEMKEKGRATRGVKQAGFLVLFKTTMPSVLIESGFLSNAAEEKYLSSEKGQDEIASSVFKAFKTYKNSVETLKNSDNELSKPESTEVKKDSIVKPILEEKKTQKDSEDLEQKNIGIKEEKQTIKNEDIKAIETPKPIDENVFWSVQFFTSPKKLAPSHKIYKEFEVVREDLESGVYKYSTGMLKNKNDAIRLQTKIREMGHKDAFVIAFYENKKISLKEASDLEKKK